MGAASFIQIANGKTAKEAFARAVEDAAFDHGHSGYTGTIAEKSEFVMISCPNGMDPEAFADDLLCEGDDRIDDKWGPAGCIALGGDRWLFFGMASC